MKLNMKTIILCSLLVSITSGLSIAQQEMNNAITLEAMPKLTKGFPSILKIRIKGPLVVPYITLMDEQIPIIVHVISKTDGKEFVIESFRPVTEHLMSNREGNQTTRQILQPPTISVPESKEYTMLFDLWSILPNLWTDTCLSDVPAGQYSVSVEFNKKNLQLYSSYRVFDSNDQQILEILKSNSIDIEFIEPSDQEKQFAKTIQGLGRVNHKAGVNWIAVLNKEIDIPDDGIPSLTQISREQISLHKLISDVNIFDEQARNKSIEDVNNASVPKFFEPERQLLLLELKGNSAVERQKLLQKYPQLKGKVEKLDAGSKTFLAPKEWALEWARLRSQSAARNDPNSHSEPNNSTYQRNIRGRPTQ